MSQSDNTEKRIGLAFPLQLGEDGRLSACTYNEHIKQSIRTLLLTARGQRAMRPEFGNRLGAYLFENIDETTASLIKSEIIYTIERYEPRVELGDIQVASHLRDIGVIGVEIAYTIISTGASDQLSLTIGR